MEYTSCVTLYFSTMEYTSCVILYFQYSGVPQLSDPSCDPLTSNQAGSQISGCEVSTTQGGSLLCYGLDSAEILK